MTASKFGYFDYSYLMRLVYTKEKSRQATAVGVLMGIRWGLVGFSVFKKPAKQLVQKNKPDEYHKFTLIDHCEHGNASSKKTLFIKRTPI